jgi:hypothetical protein
MALPEPDLEHVQPRNYDGVQDVFPAGRIRGAQRQPKVLRAFVLVYRYLTPVELDDLLDQFDAVLGSSGTFDYTPVDEVSSVKVRFDQDEIDWEELSANRFRAKVRLVEEVF